MPATRLSTPARLARAAVAFVSGGVAACTPLTAFDAAMPKDRGSMRVARGLAYGDDPRQRLDLYAPRWPSSTALPVIVWIYGGSWSSGDRRGYAFVGRALAARGFLVAVPDYRLVPQVRFPDFLRDNASAVAWVGAHARGFGGDGSRLVLAGHSAGAYDAAMLALDPQWLGPDRARLRGWAGLAGPYDFLPFDGPITVATFGRWPRPAETQPVTFAAPGAPPAFLAAGARDTTVRPANVDALGDRLAAAGVPVERRIYPRVGHVGLVTAFARPFRARAPVLDDVAAFAARVTR